MNEYWLVSAPGEETPQQTWDTLNTITAKQNNLCVNYKFAIPELKVGTLDVLVGLSDDLCKLDSYCEGVAKKIAHYLGDVLENKRDKLHENLLANGLPLESYLTRFQWDSAKYPIKQSLRNISDIIAKQTTQIDNDLKTKSTSYNNLKGNLQALARKETGSLMSRNLGDLVKKEYFVLNSEYLETLLVVVPKNAQREWLKQYETLTDMIVPRSSNEVYADDEYFLYTVTLFKKVIDEFKHHCRQNKFIVRDFTYNEEMLNAGKNEKTKLETDRKKQYGPLVRWLKVNFSEAFTGMIHVKALRVFVESVLRYGLPVNFQAVLMQPTKKTVKKLREVLNQLYRHLDTNSYSSGTDVMDIPGLTMPSSEYYSYVFYKINLDLADK